MPKSFTSFAEFHAILDKLPDPDDAARDGAAERNGQLTKPQGALGRLEELAIWYGAWRGTARPEIRAPQVVVFAANHGVVARGVSAFPGEVTAQMVLNFQAGGAAINQLSDLFGAKMDVHAIELERPTADFTEAAAMSEEECVAALRVGWDAIDPQADLLVTGEMGIGNTTSAAAIAAALLHASAAEFTGRGTGVDDETLGLKTKVVAAGLHKHEDYLDEPLEVLRRLGGREIAAIAGAMIAARIHRIPVILDGFIATSAALVLHEAVAGALDHVVAGHKSAEGAHRRMLEAIGKEPLLSLGLRLGEGSGAALAIGVLKAAVACHSGMATFAEAGVSDG